MTKAKKIAIIGIPLLIGGYLIYRQLRGSKTYQEAALETPPGTPQSQNQDGGWKKYKVTTLATPLNVRESPSTSSAKIGSLPKGSIISAKASSTSGWMEYSQNGSTISGYVSADYLTAI